LVPRALLTTPRASTTLASGGFALHENTTGSWNTAAAVSRSSTTTTGDYNTASGYQALHRQQHGLQQLGHGTNGSTTTPRQPPTLPAVQRSSSATPPAAQHASGANALFSTPPRQQHSSGFQALFPYYRHLHMANGYQASTATPPAPSTRPNGVFVLYNNTLKLQHGRWPGALLANTTDRTTSP